MITTLQLLKEYSQKKGFDTQARLAREIGISPVTLHDLKNGGSLKVDRALMIAREIGLNEKEVLLSIIYEKKSTSQRVKKLIKEILEDDYAHLVLN